MEMMQIIAESRTSLCVVQRFTTVHFLMILNNREQIGRDSFQAVYRGGARLLGRLERPWCRFEGPAGATTLLGARCAAGLQS